MAKPSTPPPDTPLPLAPLVRVIAVTALIFCSMAVITPTLGDLVRTRFEVEAGGVSLFMLVHSAPQILLLGIIFGLLSDRWGRRVPLALIGAAGTGLTTMSLPFVPIFEALLAVRFLDGLFGIVATGMLMTRAIDLAGPGARARVLGIFMTAIPIGYLGGSLLAFSAGALGVQGVVPIYLIAGGALFCSAFLLLFDLKRPEEVVAREPGLGPVLRTLRGIPSLWLPIFFGFVDKFSFALLAMLPALVLVDVFGAQNAVAWAGAAMTAFWLCFLSISPTVGRFCDRFGAWGTVAVGSGGYGVILALLVLFPSPALFVVLLGIAGVFTALQFAPTLLLVGALSGPDQKATAINAYNLVGTFGFMSGFVFAGLAVPLLGYLATFAIAGALEVACALLALAASRRGTHREVALTARPPGTGKKRERGIPVASTHPRSEALGTPPA